MFFNNDVQIHKLSAEYLFDNFPHRISRNRKLHKNYSLRAKISPPIITWSRDLLLEVSKEQDIEFVDYFENPLNTDKTRSNPKLQMGCCLY